MTRSTLVTMTLAAELVEASTAEPGPTSIVFGYVTDKPLSVLVEFNAGVVWEISRDLLREALERSTAGYGDVTFVNHGPNVFMGLASNDGYATFLFDRGDLRAFLRATQRVCEFGTEDVSAAVDEALARLLEGAR